jgi:hypothetical protein
MKRSLLLIASTAGLLLLAGTPAWADPTPTETHWTYNFTPTSSPNPSFIQADGGAGSGSVSFTNEPTKGATNSSDVVLTNLRVSSTASNSSPDTLNSNGAWSVKLQLTDSASGASTFMTFSGKLGGSFSAENANVTNTNTSQTSFTWTAPNGNKYTVTLGNFTPPGPPDASNAGSIAAHVSVTPGTGPVVGHMPEPSTLVLSCLGLSFAGLASWRKRRMQAANAA